MAREQEEIAMTTHDYELTWEPAGTDAYVAARGGWRVEKVEGGRWRAAAPDGFVTRLFGDRDLAMIEAEFEQALREREAEPAGAFRRHALEVDDPSWPKPRFPRDPGAR
jgi:hypothetical protein